MKFTTAAIRASSVGLLCAMLVSCGGESLKTFNPARILVFGDEASVIVAGATASDGRKYTINFVGDTGQIDCVSNPIWIQVLALAYAMSFPECPLPADTTTPSGVIRAVAGATAGGSNDIDLTAQISRQLALPADEGGGIGSTDLVTVYAGVNDVVAAFERYKAGGTDADATTQVEAAGETLGVQVNRITDTGGKVILSSVPDVSFTPYGQAQSLDDRSFLSYLSLRMNQRLQVSFTNDGRKIGYIQINPYLISVVANPLAYGYTNVVNGACIPLDTLQCTTNTLEPGATGLTWLWADALQLGPQGNAQLGNLAASRAKNQPF